MNDPLYVGQENLIPLTEHELAVKHYETLCNKYLDQIEALSKELKAAKTELAKYKLHAAMVGKGW